MSLTSKLTLGVAVAFTASMVTYVHISQKRDREVTAYALKIVLEAGLVGDFGVVSEQWPYHWRCQGMRFTGCTCTPRAEKKWGHMYRGKL